MKLQNQLDHLSRRTFCERWASAALGVTVLHGFGRGSLFAEESKAATPSGPGFGKAKNVIFLQMVGGMSHIDTLDPKDGPTQGPKAPIKTKADFQLGGTMENLAKHADKISIIRSMTSKTGVHAAGQYIIRTGYEERGTIKHPNIGAWAQHFLGASHKTLPSSVCVNRQPQNGNGFFPSSFAPLPILDPDAGLQYAKSEASADAMTKRLALLEQLDSGFRERFKTSEVKSYTQFYEKTISIMSSTDLEAFKLSEEPAALKEKYGKGKFGQGCLLARRLVEKGIRYVEVAKGGWDMHNNIDDGLDEHGAELDQALSALLDDLKERGLLESTLVVLCSEFGRTPKINGNAGRDHHPKVFSTLLAGGGVKGGFIYGSSDKEGMAVADKQASPQDFLSTIGWSLGLPIDEIVMSPSNRPFTVGDKGKAIMEVFA
ncbi:DUF1501 domain-containing protein [Prosthecobacter vanneervenii]|uniref:Uncharacterized protein (DUF1501 family) n=1 Tax=Prosthecobacter vanneervenii TaxID=48466 RepID=A0A7W8DI64_9BACT|nr:DUF1501 domain-containing protein [Prosthecobacter vanneervenii]MBB5030799.1 uncharacterized protein (DUF1501 family) [Prosthecobacter vanneervenii]